jgi:hypothetical protein
MDRHNSALQLLLTQLEQSKEGRWETITSDFGNKHIKTFIAGTFSELLPQVDAPPIQHSQMTALRVNAYYEGLDHSSLARCPVIWP